MLYGRVALTGYSPSQSPQTNTVLKYVRRHIPLRCKWLSGQRSAALSCETKWFRFIAPSS